MIKKIESLTNPQIKNLIKLRKASERKKQNLIIVEGEREIKIALKSGIKLKDVFLCHDYNKNKESLFFRDHVEVSTEVFDKISQRDSPDGNIATFIMPVGLLESGRIKENATIIILEGIEKPGNLGAIMRTADAAGVAMVILNNSKIDIYNPNAIRSSQGTIFSTPIFKSTIKETYDFCKMNSINIYATSPKAEQSYLDVNYLGKTAILMGSEDTGLSEKWLKLTKNQVFIQMKGLIDSLNLSVSTAIVVFEVERQKYTNIGQ